MKDYPSFCLAMRVRESGNNYQKKNTLGFLGAYQFGMARLCDLGLTERYNPTSHGYSNLSFRFKGLMTEEKFLLDSKLQDACFDVHVQKLKEQIRGRISLPRKVQAFILDLSGAIGVCHLLGFGGLQDLVFQGQDRQDAYGTKATDYAKLFYGFDIP